MINARVYRKVSKVITNLEEGDLPNPISFITVIPASLHCWSSSNMAGET